VGNIVQNLDTLNNSIIAHLQSLTAKSDKNIEDETKKLQKEL
jgi:hypothetical protein